MVFKFQCSYSLLDMSDPRPDMSRKYLWNPVKGPDKSDLEQVQLICPVCNTGLTDRIDFNTLLEFGLLSSLLESLWVLSTLVL
jgi:hypothetical protein